MSIDKVVTFEEVPLTPEALNFITQFDRLKVECPDEVSDIESQLQLIPLNLIKQVVPNLSRKNKTELLDKISYRLETGARKLALAQLSQVEKAETLKSIVEEISDIWERRLN